MTTRVERLGHGHSLSEVGYLKGGLVGLLASLVMAVVVMPLGVIFGSGFFAVPRGIASLVLSETTAATGIGIFTGLILHMLFGILYGMVFAVIYTLLTEEYSTGYAITLGISFGLLLWIINFALIGPTLVPLLVSAVPAEISILGHVVFGAVLGLYARWH